MGKFRAYLDLIGLNEDDAGTTSGDIATFTGKLDMVKRNKHLEKGKKCKKHNKLNCEICAGIDDKWN